MTSVRGNCPMGCGAGLIVTGDGRLWCAALLCPRPDAAALILAETETAHIVTIEESTFTIRHPLRERLGDELESCALHTWLASRDEAPQQAGRYRVSGGFLPGEILAWEPL